MKQALQVFSDIFSIALAAVVLGGAYIYTNPDQASLVIQHVKGWLNPSISFPNVGAADVLLLVVMAIGLVSTVIILTKGKTLLRGPISVKLIR